MEQKTEFGFGIVSVSPLIDCRWPFVALSLERLFFFLQGCAKFSLKANKTSIKQFYSSY